MELFLFLSAISLVSSEHAILTDQGLSEKDREQIISEHKVLRNLLYYGNVIGQPKAQKKIVLEYDQLLEAEAQEVANACEPIPQNPFNYNVMQPGQSTFYVRSTKRKLCNKWIDVIRSWFSYHFYVEFDKDPLPNQVPYFEIAGEFNERIGCGYAQCRAECHNSIAEYHNVFVCRYGRNLLYENEVPYERFKTCIGIWCRQ